MSIIHDALKKVQEKPDPGTPREAEPRPVKIGSSRKGSPVLAVVAVSVGILALSALAWRVGMLSREAGERDTALPPRSISSSVATAPASDRAASNPSPAVDRREGLGLDAQRYLRMGDLQKAEKLFRQALALPGEDRAEIANNLGVVLRKEGKLKEALSLYDRLLSENPRYPEAMNNRAVAFRRMGKLREAERDLREALALAPGYAVAQANLAIVLEAAGRKKEAAAVYRKYLDNPSRRPGLEEALIRRRVSLIEEGIAGMELRKGTLDSGQTGGR